MVYKCKKYCILNLNVSAFSGNESREFEEEVIVVLLLALNHYENKFTLTNFIYLILPKYLLSCEN